MSDNSESVKLLEHLREENALLKEQLKYWREYVITQNQANSETLAILIMALERGNARNE